MDTARDAGERNIAVQMGRRGDRDGIDAKLEQLVHVGDRRAAENARHEITLLAVGIGNAHELNASQAGEHTGVVRAHDACTDDADPKRRAGRNALHNRQKSPETGSPKPRLASSLTWPIPAGYPTPGKPIHVLSQSVTGYRRWINFTRRRWPEPAG